MQLTKMEPMNHDELRVRAPSIYARGPADHVSEKYSFVPTDKVLDQLFGAGWNAVDAGEASPRDSEWGRGRLKTRNHAGVARHIVRLIHPDLRMDDPDEIVPQLLLTNSHDWTSRLSLAFGLYRFVCANGLVVADFESNFLRLRHSSIDVENVIEAAADVAVRAPIIGQRLDAFRSTELSDAAQLEFASRAFELRWHDKRNPAPITPDKLLESRRSEDNAADLWTTYNVVQENIIRGGIDGVVASSEFRDRRRTKTRRADGSPVSVRRTKTRPVSSIVRADKINRGLWKIADEFVGR
tara:strand:- start:2 stop:892 length:891 start_codon:yes stop_codon:yes gene_type:complete